MKLTARPWVVVTALTLLAFSTRHYLLAPETGDIDEATFMVVAQSVLRGALPYELALDNKPAGFFYLLAGVMAVFGQSLEAVRLFGSAVVAAAAAVLWVVCRRYVTAGVSAALVALFVVAQAGSIGDSTKSELVANVFVSASLLALFALPRDNRGSFLAGLMLGCAVLTRTNLAYLALAVALMHLLAVWRPAELGLRRSSILALASGGMLPLALLLVPYALRGELPLFWVGAVEVAWSQAHGSRDLLGRLVLLVVCGLGIWRMRQVLHRRPDLIRDAGIAALYFGAIELSVVMSGSFYNHYMLQVLPPLVVLGAIGFSDSSWTWRHWVPRLVVLGIGGGVIWFGALGLATGVQQLRGELQRPLQQAARAMDLRTGDRVWATGDTQLIYYYLDLDPIVPVAAFPPNLAKEAIVRPLVRAGLMAEDGPRAAFEQRPRYVVTRDPQPPGQLGDADKTRFTESYELWHSGADAFVYRLIEDIDNACHAHADDNPACPPPDDRGRLPGVSGDDAVAAVAVHGRPVR